MKCTVRKYAYHVKYDFEPADEPARGVLFDTDKAGDAEHALVGPVDVEFEIPDDFDPRPAKVKALKDKAEKLRADFTKSITDINAQIAQLSAIEYVNETD